jgi:hypothetical protein
VETGNIRTTRIRRMKTEDLKKMLVKSEYCKRVVERKWEQLLNEALVYKRGLTNLRLLIGTVRIELGRRKGSRCPAFKIDKTDSSIVYYYCDLKKVASVHSRKNVYCNYCSRCKLTPSQVQTKMVMKRITNEEG